MATVLEVLMVRSSSSTSLEYLRSGRLWTRRHVDAFAALDAGPQQADRAHSFRERALGLLPLGTPRGRLCRRYEGV